MRFNHVFVLREQQLRTECYVLQRKICFHLPDLGRFRNGLVHKFYGLKASQMSKVHASSHEYPHVEKNKKSS